ncbi:cation:proton antiporter [Pseudomonas sp. S1_E04]|jgi:Kef-type K+ transport system membrane component KefB
MDVASIFIQLLLILFVAHVLGRVAVWLGQPTVIGHLLTGIIIGPMVLGAYDPELKRYFFSNVIGLMALSKIGLVFIMFGLGLEAGKTPAVPHNVKRQSAAGIAVAGFLGAGLAGVILAYFTHGVFAQGTERTPYMLFFGVAMAATAVPVLASILDDKRFLHRRLSALVLNAAVITDILAWFALSVVLMLVSSSAGHGILYSSLALLLLVLVAECLVSRIYVSSTPVGQDAIGASVIIVPLVVLFAFCVVSDLANAHVTIGAFVAGLAFRKHAVLRLYWDKGPHALVSMFFTPLFFGTAAMNVAIEAGDVVYLLMWGGLFFVVGAVGKVGFSYLAARLTGLSRPDSFVVASLMNTKGVMEIILLTVGLEVGVISAQLYGILMVVALFATVITLPIVRLVPVSPTPPLARAPINERDSVRNNKKPLVNEQSLIR